jgi:SAM-dependent methyltransferase
MWMIKLIIKLFLGLLPKLDLFVHRLRIFDHGDMLNVGYSNEVIIRHLRNSQLSSVAGMNILEVGPGNSVSTAFLLKYRGAKKVYLIDKNQYASLSLNDYSPLFANLAIGENKDFTIKVNQAESFVDLLSSLDIDYFTNGLAAFRTIPDSSVDFVYSHSVLQHLERDQVVEFLRELFRVMRPGAKNSNRIDLRDMLGGGLNQLRFPSWFVKSRIFQNSSCYTNGLRFTDYITLAEMCGFVVMYSNVDKFQNSVIRRSLMAKQYRHYRSDELLISGADVVFIRP